MAAELRSLLRPLTGAETDEAWTQALGRLRAEAQGWIESGRLGGAAASVTLFLLEALEAGRIGEGRAGGGIVLGFAMQLTLSSDDWDRWLALTEAEGVPREEGDENPLRLPAFPARLIEYLIKRRRFPIIRELFRLAHSRVDG